MNKVVKELVETGDWSEEQAQLAVEFDFKCAYCSKDLLESVDSHREWQTDHIVPSSAEGNDDMENYALSCRTCNFIKHIWNPMNHWRGEGKPSKNDLIDIAREYIANVRESENQSLKKYRDIVEKYS